MLIVINDSVNFKKIIELLKELLNIAIFSFNPEGITINMLDNNHISAISLTLEKSGFETYTFTSESVLKLAIDLESLCKVLKCLRNDDIITIKYDEDSSQISWIFQNEDSKNFRKFDLNLIDTDMVSEFNAPNRDSFDCKIRLFSHNFLDICKDLTQIGDNIKILSYQENNNNIIEFNVEGDIGNGLIKLYPDDTVKIDSTNDCNGKYSLKYLNIFSKSNTFSNRVNIYMENEKPIALKYKINKGLLGSIVFHLAPKND